MSNAIVKTPLNALVHSALECTSPTLMNEMVDNVVDRAMEDEAFVLALVRDGIKKRISQHMHNETYAYVTTASGDKIKRWLSIQMVGLVEVQYIDVLSCNISQFRVALRQREKNNAKRQKNYRREQKALEKVSKAIPATAHGNDRVSEYVIFV